MMRICISTPDLNLAFVMKMSLSLHATKQLEIAVLLSIRLDFCDLAFSSILKKIFGAAQITWEDHHLL